MLPTHNHTIKMEAKTNATISEPWKELKRLYFSKPWFVGYEKRLCAFEDKICPEHVCLCFNKNTSI
jgi:hypothetical protein